MRSALLTILLTIATLAGVSPSRADEVEVLSADTIRIGQHEWRLANIDAPKLDAICQAERQLARLAQDKLAEFLAQGELQIAPTGERDENGRPMARVSMNGEDIGEKMLAVRLAQRHGATRPLCKKGSGLDNFQGMEDPMARTR